MIGNSMGFIAMLMIASLGHKQLAAGALISSVSLTLLVIAWAFLFATGVVVAPYFSQKKALEVGQIVREGLLLGTIIALPLMILFWLIKPILLAFGQDPSLVLLVSKYFDVLVWGVLPSMWFICLMQFTAAVGRPRIAFYVSIIELIIMIGVGYFLMFGKFGFPKLGMMGMAYGNVFAYWSGCLVLFLWTTLGSYFRRFRLMHWVSSPGLPFLKKLFQVGYPISMQYTAELTAFSFVTIMIGWLGQTALAAQQVVLQLSYVVLIVPYGISQAGAILIAQAIGREDHESIVSYGHAAQIIGLFFIITVGMIYVIFPKALISLFSINVQDPKNAATVHLAITLLSIAAISQFFDAVRNVATGSLRAFHDTKIPMLISFIASWGISIPVGSLLGFWLGFGAAGIKIGSIVAWCIGAIILVRRFYRFARV